MVFSADNKTLALHCRNSAQLFSLASVFLLSETHENEHRNSRTVQEINPRGNIA